jgi:hypothetical protein
MVKNWVMTSPTQTGQARLVLTQPRWLSQVRPNIYLVKQQQQ